MLLGPLGRLRGLGGLLRIARRERSGGRERLGLEVGGGGLGGALPGGGVDPLGLGLLLGLAAAAVGAAAEQAAQAGRLRGLRRREGLDGLLLVGLGLVGGLGLVTARRRASALRLGLVGVRLLVLGFVADVDDLELGARRVRRPPRPRRPSSTRPRGLDLVGELELFGGGDADLAGGGAGLGGARLARDLADPLGDLAEAVVALLLAGGELLGGGVAEPALGRRGALLGLLQLQLGGAKGLRGLLELAGELGLALGGDAVGLLLGLAPRLARGGALALGDLLLDLLRSPCGCAPRPRRRPSPRPRAGPRRPWRGRRPGRSAPSPSTGPAATRRRRRAPARRRRRRPPRPWRPSTRRACARRSAFSITSLREARSLVQRRLELLDLLAEGGLDLVADRLGRGADALVGLGLQLGRAGPRGGRPPRRACAPRSRPRPAGPRRRWRRRAGRGPARSPRRCSARRRPGGGWPPRRSGPRRPRRARWRPRSRRRSRRSAPGRRRRRSGRRRARGPAPARATASSDAKRCSAARRATATSSPARCSTACLDLLDAVGEVVLDLGADAGLDLPADLVAPLALLAGEPLLGGVDLGAGVLGELGADLLLGLGARLLDGLAHALVGLGLEGPDLLPEAARCARRGGRRTRLASGLGVGAGALGLALSSSARLTRAWAWRRASEASSRSASRPDRLSATSARTSRSSSRRTSSRCSRIQPAASSRVSVTVAVSAACDSACSRRRCTSARDCAARSRSRSRSSSRARISAVARSSAARRAASTALFIRSSRAAVGGPGRAVAGRWTSRSPPSRAAGPGARSRCRRVCLSSGRPGSREPGESGAVGAAASAERVRAGAARAGRASARARPSRGRRAVDLPVGGVRLRRAGSRSSSRRRRGRPVRRRAGFPQRGRPRGSASRPLLPLGRRSDIRIT